MTAELIVQKYGGSSLSTPDRIRSVAGQIARRAGQSSRIVVIVSAMGRTTDDLLRLAADVAPEPRQRELDMLLTVGERISMALLSMALNSMGCEAISFTGSQSGILTTVSHTRALIEEIRAERILGELSGGKVVIVAGFQGVSRQREITTLGRGGSDTSAVAIAAALDAARCEIYSDVAGVFTADPRLVASARPIPEVGYSEMLELAALGARVLHYRAAEIARCYAVPLRLLSSFEEAGGTVVRPDSSVECTKVTSITSNADACLVRIRARKAADVGAVFQRIAAAEVQLIGYQRDATAEQALLALVIDGRDLTALRHAVEGAGGAKGRCDIEIDEDVATVSVVGTGFAGSAQTVARVEALLSSEGTPVFTVVTSPASVTCVIPAPSREKTVSSLHAAFFEETPPTATA